jgi:hypothetical protein
MTSDTRAAARRADRARPGGQRRSPSKKGRRSNLRTPYWAIWEARQQWLRQRVLEALTAKRKRRRLRRLKDAVLHPVQAMRQRDTSSRSAFQRSGRSGLWLPGRGRR